MELDAQPFGVTVCEETDRVVVTCCMPTIPGVSKFNQLVIYNAANFAHMETIWLTDSYDIPRCAISIGRNFAVCQGWFTPGKVSLWSLEFCRGFMVDTRAPRLKE